MRFYQRKDLFELIERRIAHDVEPTSVRPARYSDEEGERFGAEGEGLVDAKGHQEHVLFLERGVGFEAASALSEEVQGHIEDTSLGTKETIRIGERRSWCRR